MKMTLRTIAASSRPALGLLLVLLASLHVALGQATTSPFSSVIVFGDSLSDTGNVAHVTASDFLVRYPSAPFNFTDGRFTDGTDTTPAAKAYVGVWHEQLAKTFFGLTPTKNSLDGGLNYAYGSATTQDGTSMITLNNKNTGGNTLSITVENMGQQVTDYLTRPGATLDPKALYVLWGGADDLFTDPSPGNLVAAPARIAALANRLAAAGAVYILVPNLPPLGDTPFYSGQPAQVITQINAASAFFDSQLATDLGTLQSNLTTAGVHAHIYLLDNFALFLGITAKPANYGFTNITVAAQGVTAANPDAYLFWDDVHPTTAGHFQIATAADSLLLPKVVLTIAPAAPTPGEAVTFTAVVTSQPPAPAPTGTVNFYNGAAVAANLLGTGTIDSTGTATFTSSTLTPGTYTVTAVYAGDAGNLSNTSTVQTLKIAAPSTTTLALSATTVATGTAVTMTVTVAGTSGVPTGTVTFLDGVTVLGTGALNASGVATYSATSLAIGTHPLSATYPGDTTYSPSAAASQTVTVTVAPSISFSATPASITIPRGSSGTTTITATPAGGFSGAVSFACTNLPADASCSFAPATLTFIGANAPQSTVLTISTRATKAAVIQALDVHASGRGGTLALLCMPWIGLAGFGAFRKRKPGSANIGILLVMALLSLGTLAGLTACGSSPPTTAKGSYSVGVTITGAGAGNNLTIPVTVQ